MLKADESSAHYGQRNAGWTLSDPTFVPFPPRPKSEVGSKRVVESCLWLWETPRSLQSPDSRLPSHESRHTDWR